MIDWALFDWLFTYHCNQSFRQLASWKQGQPIIDWTLFDWLFPSHLMIIYFNSCYPENFKSIKHLHNCRGLIFRNLSIDSANAMEPMKTPSAKNVLPPNVAQFKDQRGNLFRIWILGIRKLTGNYVKYMG